MVLNSSFLLSTSEFLFAQNKKKSTWERCTLATQIAFQRVKNQNSPRGPNPEIHKSDARSIAPRRHSVLFYVCSQNQLKTWYNNLTIVEPLNTNIQRFPRLPRVVRLSISRSQHCFSSQILREGTRESGTGTVSRRRKSINVSVWPFYRHKKLIQRHLSISVVGKHVLLRLVRISLVNSQDLPKSEIMVPGS